MRTKRTPLKQKGGNYHTHNALPLLPGLDVVVFSNGADWVKGWRNAVEAARAGRVVMIVDSTDLLNKRHIGEKDSGMLAPFPLKGENHEDNVLPFDAVIRHPHGLSSSSSSTTTTTTSQLEEEEDEVTIVTYGTGVLTARNTQKKLVEEGIKVGILEVPCISEIPENLKLALSKRSNSVVFADPCKRVQAPLLHFVASLQDAEVIGRHKDWKFVSAAHTYNPLGSTITFLNEEEVTEAARKLASRVEK
jgi:pyruvate/2-oxoglutarate/acetoin dehydrogenase E1 component